MIRNHRKYDNDNVLFALHRDATEIIYRLIIPLLINECVPKSGSCKHQQQQTQDTRRPLPFVTQTHPNEKETLESAYKLADSLIK